MSQLLRQAIGIDMAKDKFDVCFSIISTEQKVTIRSTRNFNNTPAGFKAFDSWVQKHQRQELSLLFVLEATGVYHEQLAWHLHEQGAHVAVVLPTKARRYAQSLGLKSKNDAIDAKGLSRMGCEQSLERWQPISDIFYRLRTLTREAERLTQSKTALQNQLHALEHARQADKGTVGRIRQQLDLHSKQLRGVRKDIAAVLATDAALKARVERITQVKGLGLMSVVTVLAETDGFALFKNRKQLTSFCGYDVVENQSGKRVGKRTISKKGNTHVRRMLHMPAFNVVRYGESAFVVFYERLIAKGKKKMQAYVAVQRKLLLLIYTLWNNGEVYISGGKQTGGEETKEKETSGNEEAEVLLSPGSAGDKNKVAPTQAGATQDKLPYKESTEVLLSQV